MENNIIKELKPKGIEEHKEYVIPPDNWDIMHKVNEIINYINKKNIEENGK